MSFIHINDNKAKKQGALDQLQTTLPPWGIRAGAREKIYFDPQQVPAQGGHGVMRFARSYTRLARPVLAAKTGEAYALAKVLSKNQRESFSWDF
eukprot:scaffold311438_cov19-Tisochrysis_lutea.AAC.1